MSDDLYSIADSLDPARIRARLRRLEQSAPALRRGKLVPSSSDYTTVATDVTDTSGQVSLVGGGIQVQGSMPPLALVAGNFAATADTSSIHWYYDGTNSSALLVIGRANNTRFTVPAGDRNVTGLSANTKHYFYPFWNTLAGCSVGWVIGTTGSPQIAFTAPSADAVQQQNLLGRESLGVITYSTTAAGSSSGSAGGNPCVMSGTEIEMLLPEWHYELRIHPETEWIRVVGENGGSVNVVPKHRFYTTLGEPAEACQLSKGDWLIHRDKDMRLIEVTPFIRSCTKWQVLMEKGHLYFANGFLSSNMKLPPE